MYEGYEEKDEVVQLYLDDIIPNRFQPREVFDEQALKELAVSIKEHGVIQPIIVRNVNGKYEIIAGERRYKASALAGLTKIPAIVRNLDDKESSKVALLENLQRRNLNPIEEARTYQKILELDQMTQEELARTMGKSQSAVANKIRLLSLPEEIQDSVLKERISERHARALLTLEDANEQKELMEKVISSKMSVRALEEEINSRHPKDTADTPVNLDINASSGEYLNSTPLTPTASAVQEEMSNYGKVVIAPPKEDGDDFGNEEENKEEDMPMGKFINYGEIGKERNEDENIGLNGAAIPETAKNIDVNDLRNNSSDIKTSSSGAALDNLLNIQTPVPEKLSIEEQKQKEDYFSLPDLKSIKVDEEEQTPSLDAGISTTNSSPLIPVINNEGPSDITSGGTFTIEDAVKKIKDTVDELKSKGITVSADEMNFPKSYQVIIKIDKE